MHLEFASPTALSDTIKCFWYDRRDFGEHPSDFDVMPDGHAEIIFYFGSGCSISYQGVLQPLQSPFIMGLLNQPFILNTKNRFEVIGIRCFPWTVFDLLGLPSGKEVTHLAEHPIALLQPVLQTLIDAGRIEDAVDQIKAYFLTIRSGLVGGNMLHKAGQAMSNANGTLPVSQVAEAAHATVRTLERNFKQSSGHTVKDVSALMRFEQVRNHLLLHPKVNLASLAHELGYTDQSHLSREFKRYSGTTPAAFAKNKGRAAE